MCVHFLWTTNIQTSHPPPPNLTCLPPSPNFLTNFPPISSSTSLLASPLPPPVSGPQLLLQLGGGELVTVESLLDEVYQKASAYRLWPLLRHTAGLLHKHVEDLAQVGSVCTVTVCTNVYCATNHNGRICIKSK